MKTQHSIFISKTIGSVSAECVIPHAMTAMLTLAHGAGAGMNHSFMILLADELAAVGIGTMRFNFPFTEQKKKRPDFPAVAHHTIACAVDFVKQHYSSTPLYLSGKSFGGRMSSQALAINKIKGAKGIILFGFPLHPASKPSVERAEHLKDISVPMLFLQGTRDALAEWTLIERVCAELPQATLAKFEGADHSFKVGKQNIIPLLARSVNNWIETT